jgi:hypothetical protein
MPKVVKYVKLTAIASLSVLIHGGRELEHTKELLVATINELGGQDCTLELNASYCIAMKPSTH